ncbi:MAG: two-component system cell cycle sensor histidine kinase/response regulator CckA [Pseudohongiellaceae bacterium]|jgi:two-component system cell cycle sensor histidine kinase/response regulator CckA
MTTSCAKKLQEILTASTGATELCNQMLAYAGGGSLATGSVDCNGLIRELGGLLRVGLSKKSLLVDELSKDGLFVLADRGQLRQVIMFLIRNASEALNDQEGRIVLSTSSRHFDREELTLRSPHAGLLPGESVCLSVGDTGEGLDERTKDRTFDFFFTTKAAGRGLGLAAV